MGVSATVCMINYNPLGYSLQRESKVLESAQYRSAR
jgi:hypothetical protein